MFHALHPSDIALASQRLKEKMVKLPAAVHGESFGVSLNFQIKGGLLQKFETKFLGGAAQDEFICAFFLAYETLFRGKALSELEALSLREWESYWRDLNHLMAIGPELLEASSACYEQLLDILLEEVWRELWSLADVDAVESQDWLQMGWIDQLRWFEETLLKLEDVLKIPRESLELVNLKDEILYLSLSNTDFFSPRLLFALKNFLIRQDIDIKEIKLVA